MERIAGEHGVVAGRQEHPAPAARHEVIDGGDAAPLEVDLLRGES